MAYNYKTEVHSALDDISNNSELFTFTFLNDTCLTC